MLNGKAAIVIAVIFAIVLVAIIIMYCYYPSSNDCCDDKESSCKPRHERNPTSPPASQVDWERWKSVKRAKANESHSSD